MRGCLRRVEKWQTLQELVGCMEPSLWVLKNAHRESNSKSWVDLGKIGTTGAEGPQHLSSLGGKFWDERMRSRIQISFNSFALDGVRSFSGKPTDRNKSEKVVDHRSSSDQSHPRGEEGAQDGLVKWFSRELIRVPNALSLSRMFSGPVIAHWIVSDQWLLAVSGLAIAGVTDWLDGYVAKRQGQQSVIGSYLDPLADKVLIGCTVGALVYRGSIPFWVAGTVVARDLFLVAGTMIHHSRQSRGVGWDLLRYIRKSEGTKSGLVQPMFISKINTVVQLGLVAGCIGQGWLGWPGDAEVLVLSGLTVTSTLISWGAYVRGYFVGRRAIP
ncbi:hypothetical protein BSKO_03741 [Bryopsis sp. KO-2023]|nr:hypothetical protein BSKO_03741 [Bryopsis sp. KO-2023]